MHQSIHKGKKQGKSIRRKVAGKNKVNHIIYLTGTWTTSELTEQKRPSPESSGWKWAESVQSCLDHSTHC